MSNIIIMPAFSETGEYQPFYHNSRKSWEAWCKKHGHEFYVINSPVAPFSQIPPQAQKMWVYDVVKGNDIKFEQAAVVDYDTFVMPDCPDFFKMSENNWVLNPPALKPLDNEADSSKLDEGDQVAARLGNHSRKASVSFPSILVSNRLKPGIVMVNR